MLRDRSALTILAIPVLLSMVLTACSVKRMAVNVIGDALSDGGGVYASDDDPQLIREAIPFGLKTYESLLAVSPDHRGLLLAAGRGFTVYAFLLQKEADLFDAADIQRARALRARARQHYLRGRDYALRGLAQGHDDFTARLFRERTAALEAMTREDVPFLYWAGVAWAGALSAAKDDLGLIADLPIAAALVERVLELDENYELGAAHEFMISYEGSRPGGNRQAARRHYRRALELSQGARASTHLALAESVTIREQNLKEFRALIAAALAVEPDLVPQLRLANTIAQHRAKWLESRIPELFVETDLLG
ncbi:MAG: TRAP transporter TatT component family protein [Alphaproteobacteria bacterium]